MVSMILQGGGGAVGAVALQNTSIALAKNKNLRIGDDVMVAGLATQTFTLFVFISLGADFALRVRRRRKTLGDAVALAQDPRLVALRNWWPFQGFLVALASATIAVFWRSAYRCAELNQGWTGPLTYDQGLFVGFEGVLIVVAVAALGFFHPSLCLGVAMDMLKASNAVETTFSGDRSKVKATSEAAAEPNTFEMEGHDNVTTISL
jgi:hypothetical protein